MPIDIPIIYTGKEVATPDWKSFYKDLNQRQAYRQAQQQQQAQFDALQQERLRKELLSSLDLDKLNSTNEGLVEQSYGIYQTLENQLTGLLESNGGKPTTRDFVVAKMLNVDANKQMADLNQQQNNWNVDKKAVLNNPELYDQEKAKTEIFNWDGKTPYKESKLESVLRDVDTTEVATAIHATIKDPNTHTWVASNAGQKFENEQTRDATYWDFDPTNNTWKPKYKEQVNYDKSAIASKGEKAVLYLRSIDQSWNKVSPKEKEYYEQLSLNSGLEKDDARYLYFNNTHNIFGTKESTQPYTKKEKSETDKDKRELLDLRQTTEGSMASKPVPITGTITYFDSEGKEKTYNAGLNDVRLTKIYYDNNRGEWMVDGVLKRGTSEEDIDKGVFSTTINDPITMTYNSVKEDINRLYNVTLPVEKQKKKAY